MWIIRWRVWRAGCAERTNFNGVSKPTTALLIPCYNAEPYLENLRGQVDALNPAFDELIVVDDGSTDGTVAKARALGFDIKSLGANRGPGAARNAAVELATAEWLHFLDADDEIAPDYLAKVLPLAGDDVDVVLSGCDYVYEDSRQLLMRWQFPTGLFVTNPLEASIVHQVVSPCTLIRHSSFKTAGGFDEDLRCWEDADFVVQLARHKARFCVLDEVLAVSPRHKRGVSGSDLYCQRCRLAFLKRYLEYVPHVSKQTLVSQLVINATRLAKEGDWKSVDEALTLANNLGWNGPDSGHPLLALLARIPLPKLRKVLFRLQMMARGSGRRSKTLIP